MTDTKYQMHLPSEALTSTEVRSVVNYIADRGAERVSGDVSGQLFYLTQMVGLLAVLISELPGWMAKSR